MVTAKFIFIGFKFHAEINSYTEEWINMKTGKIFRIKKSSDFISEDELLNILEQAGISANSFINI